MELSGEEKKLQALFSELKAVDKQTAPHFGATWNRAQIAPRTIRMFKPAFVAALILLSFGVVAFAVWSRFSRTMSSPQPIIANAPQPSTTAGAKGPPALTTETPGPKPKNASVVSRRNKTTSQHNPMLAGANRKLEKEANSIANWTSPTSALLESPSDEIFSSLPELNRSATQLKSFLPSRSN